MEIKAGKRYKNRQDDEITVLSWDNSYGVWRCSFKGNGTMAVHKNGMRFSDGSICPHDLVSEIREPRTFYVNEYQHADGTTCIGRAVYEKDKQDLAHQGPYKAETKTCKIIKLVEVLD